jgi:hypothetical protein
METGIIYLEGTRVTLENNYIHDNESNGINSGIIYCASGDISIIEHNLIKNNKGWIMQVMVQAFLL